MTWQLVEEVLDHAPADLTPAETLLLVVIAEYCGADPRLDARECDCSTADLARRMKLKINGVQEVLRRLAKERKLDVRVPLGEDKNGSPVYAFRGRVPRYRMPEFPAPEGCPCRTCKLPNKGPAATDPSTPEGSSVNSPFTAEGSVSATPSAEEGSVLTVEGSVTTTEGSVLTTEGSVSTDPLPSSVLPTVREGGRTEEETAARLAEPAAVEHKRANPSEHDLAEALALIAALPWPDGQRPNRAKANELAVLVHAAVIEHGQTLAELDVHLRGRLRQATRNAASYLARAIAPDELPIPSPAPTPPGTSTPQRPRAVINEASPRDPRAVPPPATEQARAVAVEGFRRRRPAATTSAQLRAQSEGRELLTPEQEQQRRNQLLASLQAAHPEISTEVIPSAS
ncbi:hypothetical protein BBK82_03695 [Lentzea guizhouensis]|uniref:Helix-turn-helix domain-containing protein n=1 Tax=Lentzea guizhouensis TaxID=1586287 RepID=A0A1B2HC70_9PSEU|nr:hypothetical protein [Lentzea guizhouensis]ANZ35320.1 hypothetical protein BBK82_03695 [Lentzea guizhouensis]